MITDVQNRKMTVRKSKGWLTSIINAGDRAAFNWEIRQSLYRHIAVQVANSVPIERALETFRARLQRRKKTSSDKIVASVIRKMKDGSTMSEALSLYLPTDETTIISSGELSGNLPRALTLLVESKRRVERVKKAFKSSMISPLVYLVVMYIVLYILGSQVIPGLQVVFPADKATGLISILYSAGNWANSYWSLLPPVLALLAAIAINHSLPRWTGKYRIIAEEYFPYSFYRDIQGYTWLMSFTSLLRAGMSDTKILLFQTSLATPWLRERVKTFWSRMDNGSSLSVALLAKGKKGMPAFGFPNPNIVDDISSYADFQDFPEKIADLANEWAGELEEECVARAKRWGFYVEIVMYIAMGTLMWAINDLSVQLGSIKY